MNRPFALVLVSSVLLLCILALSATRNIDADVLQAAGGMNWYRGNLHTHSHWSDGDDYLEMIALWYRDHDYQFLVFSDHNVLPTQERWVTVEKSKGGKRAFEKLVARFPNWTDTRMQDGAQQVRLHTFPEVAKELDRPGQFLLIQGEEISDSFEKLPIHLIATNVEESISPRHGSSVFETIQNNVDAVIAQRELTGRPMIVHLNHPNFHFAVTAEDLMRVQGEKFFEVYNGHPGVHNSGDHHHASTEKIWDIVLAQRLGALDLPVMYGVAVDDGHNYHQIPSRASEPGRGWVMVLARELTPEALIEALEAGRFYASSGVTLSRVESSAMGLSVTIDPAAGEAYTIDFIGTRKSTDLRGKPVLDEKDEPVRATLRYDAKVGETFQTVQGNSAEYRFQGDELYVRARITSSVTHPNPSEVGDLKQAWTQPVVGPAVQQQQ